MKRRAFLGTALVGLPITGAFAAQPKPKGGDIPTTTLGKTGIAVQIIAQGGARMDLHPDIPSAAKHVRDVYELGLRYFDCARMYWNGQSEEAYGLGLQGVRKNVFLTSKSAGRTAEAAQKDLETSLRLLKTDHVDLWQMHDIRTAADVEAIMKPGGAIEAFEAAKKAGKCRLIGFTGHFDPDAHVAMLKAYDHWDTVMMPVHAADHAYLSFEQDCPARGPGARRAQPGHQGLRQGQPVAVAEPRHLPALCAEPAGDIDRHLWVRHGRADGRQHSRRAELPQADAGGERRSPQARHRRRRRLHRHHAGVLEEAGLIAAVSAIDVQGGRTPVSAFKDQ